MPKQQFVLNAYLPSTSNLRITWKTPSPYWVSALPDNTVILGVGNEDPAEMTLRFNGQLTTSSYKIKEEVKVISTTGEQLSFLSNCGINRNTSCGYGDNLFGFGFYGTFTIFNNLHDLDGPAEDTETYSSLAEEIYTLEKVIYIAFGVDQGWYQLSFDGTDYTWVKIDDKEVFIEIDTTTWTLEERQILFIDENFNDYGFTYQDMNALAPERKLYNVVKKLYEEKADKETTYTKEEIEAKDKILENINSAGRLFGGEITILDVDPTTEVATIQVASGGGLVKLDEAGPEDTPTTLNEGQGSRNTFVTWLAQTVTLIPDAYNFIYYDKTDETFKATTNFYEVSFTQDFTVGRVVYQRNGTVGARDHQIAIRLCGTNIWNFDRRVQLFGEEVFPVVRAKGLMIGNTAPASLGFTLTKGILWAELVNRFSVGWGLENNDDFLSTTHEFSYWYRGADNVTWVEVPNQTLIDDDAYDIENGTLGTVDNTPQRYGVHWVYVVHDDTVHVVYGRGNYTLANAQNAPVPTQLPLLLSSYATLVGKIIVGGGQTTFESIETPFTTQFNTAGVTDHTELSNLNGDSSFQHLTSTQVTKLNNIPDDLVVTATITYFQETEPVGGNEGELWYNTTNQTLYEYQTDAWVSIGSPVNNTFYTFGGANFTWDGSDLISITIPDLSLDEDITAETNVGFVESSDVLEQGLTFKQFIERMFVNPIVLFFPTLVEPSSSIVSNQPVQIESGSEEDVELTVTFNRGQIVGDMFEGSWNSAIEQNKRAGALTNYEIGLDGEEVDTETTNTYTVVEHTFVDGENKFTGIINHEEGPQPIDSDGMNFESPYPAGSLTSSVIINGVRKAFFGHSNDAIDSDDIRGLEDTELLSGFILNPKENDTFTITAEVGATNVVFAYPATLRDVFAVNQVGVGNAKEQFEIGYKEIEVEGANGYDSITYKVYVFEPVEPFSTQEVYEVII